jgi:hypothetical protein
MQWKQVTLDNNSKLFHAVTKNKAHRYILFIDLLFPVSFLSCLTSFECNDTERQNMVTEISEKCLLILQREMDFTWGERLRVEYCVREGRSGTAWLVAGVWKLKGERTEVKEDARHV